MPIKGNSVVRTSGLPFHPARLPVLVPAVVCPAFCPEQERSGRGSAGEALVPDPRYLTVAASPPLLVLVHAYLISARGRQSSQILLMSAHMKALSSHLLYAGTRS